MAVNEFTDAVKIIVDNKAMWFGAADDASIVWDGTDLVITATETSATGGVHLLGLMDHRYTETSLVDARPEAFVQNYKYTPASPPGTPIDVHGIDLVGWSDSANTDAQVDLYPFESHASYQGTGTIGELVPMFAFASNTTSGTVTAVRALRMWANNSSTGTVTDLRYISIENPGNGGGGTITTAYGIYIADITTGGTNYGIYNLAPTLLAEVTADSLAIGQATATTPLDVKASTDNNLGGIRITDFDSAGFPVLIFQNANNGAFELYASNVLKIRMHCGAHSYMNSGFFYGIGTATPNEMLEVGGHIRLSGSDASIYLAEKAAADTDVAAFGQLWVKNTTPNELWFTDDAGLDVQVAETPQAYSGIGTHDVPANEFTMTISTQDIWTKYTDITNAGHEDPFGNIVADVANDKVTIGANGGGVYDIQCSISALAVGGALNKLFFFGIARDCTSPTAITSNTLASPTVITATAHGLEIGDSVVITGSDDASINGTFVIATVPTADTFTMIDFAGAAINSASGGTGGTIDTEVHWSCISHRMLTSSTAVGNIAITGEFEGIASDDFYVVVLNRTDTSNLIIQAVSFRINRIGLNGA